MVQGNVQDFLIEISMQNLLRQACATLGIPEPTYTKHDAMLFQGRTYYRFYASLKTDLIGHPPVSMGRYANTDDNAREDVALALLRRLVACSKREIEDFNFHNISLYEDKISAFEAENFDLIVENGKLKDEIRMLRRMLGIKGMQGEP